MIKMMAKTAITNKKKTVIDIIFRIIARGSNGTAITTNVTDTLALQKPPLKL